MTSTVYPLPVNPSPSGSQRALHRPSNEGSEPRRILPLFARVFDTDSALGSCSVTLIYLAVYTIICAATMNAIEDQDWSAIDAVYFTVVTMSTVGYGDLTPATDGGKIFVIFAAIVGIVAVFARVATGIGLLAYPITCGGRKALERLFPREGVEIFNDGEVDFYQLRSPTIYYAKNLLPSLTLNVLLQLASAGIFCAIDEDWRYFDALYHCIITATTVGFGDVPNDTQAGRLWACFHIVVSVALLGELISTFDELREERKSTMRRQLVLTTHLTASHLDRLLDHAATLRPLVERDGLGLTELEFVLAMMIELEVVEFDVVRPFIKQFRLLDVDQSRRLSRDDLARACNQTIGELQRRASLSNRNSKFTVDNTAPSQGSLAGRMNIDAGDE
jgi:potassium channel subfamily K